MKKNPISALQNENGAVLLYVLVISLIVVGIFTSTMIQNQNSERQIYQARFRNQLDAFETRWQTLMGQPSTYINCQFNVPNSCQIDQNVIKKYTQLPLVGGGCSKPSSREQSTAGLGDGVKLPTCNLTCGFCASVSLDPTDGSIAHLVVNPVGTSLRPVQVAIQIPYDVLQVQTISCPDIDETKPRFGGLDAKGNAICLPLIKPKCQYPGIQYAYGIDAGTGAILCKNIPNIKIKCPDSKYMSIFGWSTVALGDGCTSRLWPYVFSYYDDPKPSPPQPTPTPVGATPAPTPAPTATPEGCNQNAQEGGIHGCLSFSFANQGGYGGCTTLCNADNTITCQGTRTITYQAYLAGGCTLKQGGGGN